ncbi:protein of unknown function DUF565 [Rippkaea orientalis PCC 8801]|uniref:DUF565 domain-containing protein n=1 Tax=Rippkaea orientalis (strain PCC 8801 / RF-1) TaxID=41431 RepID=B7JY13_RIPO1|nr:DUF565 domain-containing protein [Rippkaea orientalis]ACK65977.1 protein of unknown function DUF565 [Rippkaea orientalis PCC 8801]
MQRTRLNTLFAITQTRLNELFSNPWRRIALSLISLLLGFFVGQAVTTSVGQSAYWDITVAGFFLLFTEFISRTFYSRLSINNKRLFWLSMLNTFKMGVIYGLYLEALKLGS